MSTVHTSDSDLEAKRILNNLNKIRTPPKENKLEKPFKREIVWKNVAVYVIGHILAIYGLVEFLFFITWPRFIASSIVALVMGEAFVSGTHRYYAHRCFKASKLLQIIFLLGQTASSQNCLWVWVRDHRQHHKYADTDADPHNAKNGFFFSHVGWLLTRKHPEVIEKGKGIDMSDMESDPLVMFQKKHYNILWLVFAIVLPVLYPVYVFGSPLWQAFLIEGVFRIVITLNSTWMVNSWAHLYGDKPFDKNIMPVESYLVSFVAIGEGWHNYHHTFPYDYKASELGAPFNLTAHTIRLLARLGMAWDLKEASPDMVITRACRTGDGTPIRARSEDKCNSED